jgi:hypothetical protein
VGAALRPLHLLFLTEALADHLIHRRFDKAGADAFALTIALAIIGNERNGIQLSMWG